MKVLKNAKFTGNIKINDTNTDIYFQAYDDGVLQKLNADQCSFRIKNDTGYLITISNVSTETDYITFKSNELKSLPVGTYYLELWVEDGTGTYIYPDESFCKLRINENVTVAQGTTIPTISLDEYENKLQGYVDNAVADGKTEIKDDFDKYVDSITDSTITTATKASQDAATAINTANSANDAAQNATNIANAAKSNADAASQNASTALGTANTAKSTADAANSTANAANSSATDALNKATANSNLIKEGVFLQLVKSFAQVNTSQNLIVNSDMFTDLAGADPASPWQEAYGWSYADGSRPIRSSWHGGNSLKLEKLSNTNYLVSSGIYTGISNSDTAYSASFMFDGDGTLNEGDTVNVYIEFAYQADFQNSQKVLLYEINSSNYSTGNPKKENFKAPYNYNWARLRVECNISDSTYFIWLRQPLLNIGETCITYRCSESAGQRILDIEKQLKSIQQTQSTILKQIGNIQDKT